MYEEKGFCLDFATVDEQGKGFPLFCGLLGAKSKGDGNERLRGMSSGKN